MFVLFSCKMLLFLAICFCTPYLQKTWYELLIELSTV